MDYLSLLLVMLLTLALSLHVFKSKRNNSLSLPPGPTGFPIIGNILEMGSNPHKSLANLSKTFGPLMTLKLGSLTTIVMSSPEFVKEAFQTHDQALSGRTVTYAARADGHHDISLLCLPASDQWRSIRKVLATKLFSTQKMEGSQDLRQKKVKEMLLFVEENCKTGQPIDIGQAAFIAVFNVISNAFFSTDLASYNSKTSQHFCDTVVGIMEELGKPNLANYFPILQSVDLQGTRKRTKLYFERFYEVFDDIIVERLKQKSSTTEVKGKEDLLDFLLNANQEANKFEMSLVEIKRLFLDLFVAGSDTTAKTIEWGMAELLRNPEKLLELKNELKEVEGDIQESDIHKLPYLQATVKEIFRLHPPAPFLVPHKAECDIEIGGFKIPKNAHILVNVWAMGRDESIWENPDMFEPERFMACKIDVKGRDFELIPFGAGRRICPGLLLGHRMLHLSLASLIHSFDWTLSNDIKPNELDMIESYGLTLSRAHPLLAIPCL
ncbi:cytochrome P450 family 76 subfamily C polypeptide 4 [Euphorbia peplus]|nr:cytochrome P450 family 76 subfamily C polypeptide 4 [Euphorbia peplus]